MSIRYRFRRNSAIGAMDAESDEKFLRDCFIDNGDLETLLDCDDAKRVVVGRVGAGKSALLNRLIDSTKNAFEVKAENLSLNYISNSDIIQFFEAIGVKLDIFYQLLWRHVFTVELLKRRYKFTEHEPSALHRIFQDLFNRDPAKKRAVQYLESWGSEFWKDTELRIRDLTTKLEERLTSSLGTSLAQNFNINLSSAKTIGEDVRTEIIHKAQNVVNANQVRELGEIIDFLASEVFTDPLNRYYIVIDRLDENWVDERVRYKLIRALIETVRAFQKVRTTKIIIAIREDLLRKVFDETRDAGFQEEKYDSFFLRIRWKKTKLKELLDTRIAHLVREQYTQHPVYFNDVFRTPIRSETAIDYVVDRSLNRPRDVIAFVNCCIELCEGKEFVSPSTVQDAEKKYSEGRLRSLGDEWRAEFPGINNYVELIRARPSSFKYSEIGISEFESFMTDVFQDLTATDPMRGYIEDYISGKRSPNNCLIQMLKILYLTSVIGIKPQATDRTSWSHSEDRGISDGQYKAGATIYPHKMLWRALDITPPPRQQERGR